MSQYLLINTNNKMTIELKNEQAVIDATNKLLAKKQLDYCYEDNTFDNRFEASLAILKFNNFKLAKIL